MQEPWWNSQGAGTSSSGSWAAWDWQEGWQHGGGEGREREGWEGWQQALPKKTELGRLAQWRQL